MTNPRSWQSLQNLNRAVQRLCEALQEPQDSSLVVDGTIQRFEFVFELFWKSFKLLLTEEGIEVMTPREALRQAYKVKWIDDEEAWLQMLHDRNQTSHLYDEAAAMRIYRHIRKHFPELERALKFLKERFEYQERQSG